jgi:hypothetical protein
LADLRWKEAGEGAAVDDELAVEVVGRTGADGTGMTMAVVVEVAVVEAMTL